MQKTKILNQKSFQKDIELYIDKLISNEFEKIVLKSEDNSKNDVVILPIDEYERLKNLYENFKDLREESKK